MTNSSRLNLSALIALVVGSMIGGGIFSLPQNVAASAGPGAMLIGWLITGVGMLTLAFVFQTLANRKPELDAGIYAYAKAGFGNFMGFSSAWGYWISAWIGNVSYLVLLFSTLGLFFPIFGEGNTLPAILCASALLWAIHFLVMKGLKEAAFVNLITTIAKVVPLILFIVVGAFAFSADVFTNDFWGSAGLELGRPHRDGCLRPLAPEGMAPRRHDQGNAQGLSQADPHVPLACTGAQPWMIFSASH